MNNIFSDLFYTAQDILREILPNVLGFMICAFPFIFTFAFIKSIYDFCIKPYKEESSDEEIQSDIHDAGD